MGGAGSGIVVDGHDQWCQWWCGDGVSDAGSGTSVDSFTLF